MIRSNLKILRRSRSSEWRTEADLITTQVIQTNPTKEDMRAPAPREESICTLNTWVGKIPRRQLLGNLNGLPIEIPISDEAVFTAEEESDQMHAAC